MPTPVLVLLLLLLIPLAIMFLMGKGASLIAGYNTMSQDKQQQYDEKKLCQGMGMFLLVLSGLLIVFYVIEQSGSDWALYMLLVLVFIGSIGFNSYMFRSKTFKQNYTNKRG